MNPLYLEDEAFIAAWEGAKEGQYPLFPGLSLEGYASLDTNLFQSFGGRIPVLHMKDRGEFEDLIRRIFYKGEPRPIPASMGALTIKGWKDLSGQAHRIILLSDGYYSAVPPEEMGLSAKVWKEKSFLLRRAHEYAHYYTLRAHGFMNNHWKDELIADASGLIEAFGEYKSSHFLRFMGLENHPAYREGGRLQNYLPKDRELTAEEWLAMRDQVVKAARSVEELIKNHPEFCKTPEGKRQLIDELAKDSF